MRYLVTYHTDGMRHARHVEACCEAAAVAATQEHVRRGSDWHVSLAAASRWPDIVGGAAVCPLRGRHKETEA